MAKPELKQFGDLTPGDFECHPVWIGCHTADYDEPWYDQTDEETFRPRTGDLPAEPSEGIVGDRRFYFWGGIPGVPAEEREAMYVALSKKPDEVFPLRFYVDPTLSSGVGSGEVQGFYRTDRKKGVQVDR